MKSKFLVSGMTCSGCESTIEKSLCNIIGVERVQANVKSGTVPIESNRQLTIIELQLALPERFKLSEFQSDRFQTVDKQKSKIAQLFPLFLILFYVLISSILLNNEAPFQRGFMLDFMGLFFIVFSFFKLLDLKGFKESFAMYDPLAIIIPSYGFIYPFIEVILGLFFLLRIYIDLSLLATILILGMTSVGVTRALINKKSIICACLGSTLNLPMTLATFIENAIMIVMAVIMLFASL